MMTGTLGFSRFILLPTTSPELSGNANSSNTRSTRLDSNSLIALLPESAPKAQYPASFRAPTRLSTTGVHHPPQGWIGVQYCPTYSAFRSLSRLRIVQQRRCESPIEY